MKLTFLRFSNFKTSNGNFGGYLSLFLYAETSRLHALALDLSTTKIFFHSEYLQKQY